jgi:hypothetical protein
MTALLNAMATRNWFLTTVKALERALRQAEFDGPATDSAPFFSRAQRYMSVHVQVGAWVKILSNTHSPIFRSLSLSGNPRGREATGIEAAQTVNPVQTTRFLGVKKGYRREAVTGTDSGILQEVGMITRKVEGLNALYNPL